MAKLSSVCLITPDVPRLRDFYRQALQVDAEGGDDYVALATEGARLSIFPEQGMEEMAPGSMRGAGHGGCVLEFEVEDVDREYERLTKMRVPIVKPPMTHPWGLRSVWFRDPDGNVVNFYATAVRE